MVLLLGATTYIGQAFARALRRRKDPFIPLSRSTLDYAQFEFLFDYVRKVHPDLLINADERAGMEDWSDAVIGTATFHQPTTPSLHPSNTARPYHPISVDESDRIEMLQANTLLPQTIARVCEATNTPWGHVSSGSIYSGAKIADNGSSRIADLTLPSTRDLFATHPEKFRGFAESDAPNFSFKAAPCTFYSGTKALAEEALTDGHNYVWRLRLPFNEDDDPSNFLSRLLHALTVHHSNKPLSGADSFGTCPAPSLAPGATSAQTSTVPADILHDAINSLSHLDDCVGACLELWDRRTPFGIYNVVNPGVVRTHELVVRIQRILKPAHQLQLLVYDRDGRSNDDEKPPRSDCILDISKLLKTGVKLRPVEEAIEKSLRHWHPHTSHVMKTLP